MNFVGVLDASLPFAIRGRDVPASTRFKSENCPRAFRGRHSDSSSTLYKLVAADGFEPPLSASEADLLPVTIHRNMAGHAGFEPASF